MGSKLELRERLGMIFSNHKAVSLSDMLCIDTSKGRTYLYFNCELE